VRQPLHMLVLLSGVVFQFIVFFAFQHGFLALAAPGSFDSLLLDPVSLLLHSTAIFSLNPLYLPTTTPARASRSWPVGRERSSYLAQAGSARPRP
jgi:hypothetical protein